MEDYPRWCKYLALYRPMVTENTLAFIELRDSADILSPLPAEVYASMFVNEARYLVVSNFTNEPYTVKLASPWEDRQGGTVADTFTVPHGKILFLKQ